MRGDDDSLYHGTYLVPYQDQLAATRLLAVREETWGDATWAEDAISHLSLNPPGLLESIQSFAYHCCESVISAESISLLATSLPHLRILILETREIKGDVTFPHLHTLQIISDNINLYGWQCPTLQHLALTTNDVLDGHRYDLSIIPDQFSGLTALLVRSLAVTLDDTFWSRFPRLEMLGFYRITVVDPPPKSHPLSHLYSPRYDIYYTQPDEISAALDVLNPDRERTLQIGRIPPAPDLAMNSFSKDWEQLHKKCKAAGIRWRKLPADVDFVDEWPKLQRDFWKDDRIGVWIKTWRVELFFASILGLVTVVLVAELLHFSAPRAWDRLGQGEAIAWGVVFPLYYLSNVIKLDLRRFIPTQVD
ncbi:hypothetical protein FRC17_007061 [Serendipita sp. 399]|nr:hypothetical protein FRC17_007061 [Serendipita sp. 399]